MNSTDIIAAYEYAKKRLKCDHSTIFVNFSIWKKSDRYPRYGYMYFCLEDRLHYTMCILAFYAFRYAEETYPFREIIQGKKFDRNAFIGNEDFPRLWVAEKHHYLVNQDELGHKKYAVRCMLRAVNSLAGLVRTLRTINNHNS